MIMDVRLVQQEHTAMHVLVHAVVVVQDAMVLEAIQFLHALVHVKPDTTVLPEHHRRLWRPMYVQKEHGVILELLHQVIALIVHEERIALGLELSLKTYVLLAQQANRVTLQELIVKITVNHALQENIALELVIHHAVVA